MDKKLIKGGLIVLAALGTLYVYNRYAKKIKKQIEEQEKQENEELENLGISTEKLNEEIDPYDDKNNMVKALAASCFFNPEIDYDIIDVEKALDASRLISVSQENFMFRGTETTDLVYYFDIPNYLKGGYSAPRLGDYCNAIKEAAEKAWSDIVRFCPKPRCRLAGFIVVSYDDPEDPEYRTSEKIEIDDPTIYEELKSDFGHDGFGLGKLYEGAVNQNLPESVKGKLSDWISKKWNTEKLPGFEVIEIQLVYRVSFVMQDKTGIGINIKTAFQTLKMFTEELEIKRAGKGNGVRYENVLFCAPSNRYTDRFDLTHYYYVNEDNKIDQDSYSA
jgi:hypothetical protein